MIENMRKYTGLMVVVLVLLAAGLVLTMGVSPEKSSGGRSVTSVYGEDVSSKEFDKLGINTLRTLSYTTRNLHENGQLSGMIFGQSPLARYSQAIGAALFLNTGNISGEAQVELVQRRLVIRRQMQELGIYVSEEQAKQYIIESMFSITGKYDSEAHEKFVKNLGRYTEEEFVQLVAESMAFEKLLAVITSNISESDQVAKSAALFNLQTLNVSTIKLDVENYKKAITPSEEEIKTYWQENEGKYLTNKLYKLSYISDAPVYAEPKPAEPTAPKKPEEPTGASAELTVTQDQYKKDLADWEKQMVEHEKVVAKWQEDLSAWNKNVKQAAIKKMRGKFRVYYDTVVESAGKEFENAAKSKGTEYDVQKTDFIAKDALPAELKDLKVSQTDFRGFPTEVTLGEAIFSKKLGKEARTRVLLFDKNLSNDGIVFVRIDEIKEPESKQYEDAKKEATADLITEKAYEAMLEDAKKLKVSLAEAVKGGKTLAEAAKAKSLTVENIPGLSFQTARTLQQQFPINLGFVLQEASLTDNQSFTDKDIEMTEESTTLIYLNNRSVVETEDFEDQLKNGETSYDNQLKTAVFQAWLTNALNNAELAAPNSN